MHRTIAHLIYLAVILQVVKADFGACRYDMDMCSCKRGNEDLGTCWDQLPTFPGFCSRRTCRAGWTCSCAGRTHLCNRGAHTALRVAPEDMRSPTALCSATKVYGPSSRRLILGAFNISISEKGVAANACNELAWWHNGELMGNHKPVSDMTSNMVEAELSVRKNHLLLELRPGDLLSFRFRAGSYYCFKNYAEFSVNGTSLNLFSKGVSIRYARRFTEKWFDPQYEPQLGSGEDEPDLTYWIPLRSAMLESPHPIVPGEDLFQELRPDSLDHKQSNWYFRIQIPSTLAS